MKTQNSAHIPTLSLWNSWKRKQANSSRFVSRSPKQMPAATTPAGGKKTESDKAKNKRAVEIKVGYPQTTCNTQRLDVCFSSLWRQCV
jgi:hypothetical protein